MKKKKSVKLLALFMTLMIVLSSVILSNGSQFLNASAATIENDGEYSNPTIEIANANVKAGESFNVPVKIYNNPGITSMNLAISFDLDSVVLTNIVYNSSVIGGTALLPQGFEQGVDYQNNNFVLNWVIGTSDLSTENYTFATLTFRAKENVGSSNVTCTYDPNNIYNLAEDNINFDIANSTITVTDEITSAVALAGSITTPSKNTADASSLTGDNVSAAVTWSPALTGGKFAANTAYTATVTVLPAQYYTFEAGASVTYDDLTFTKSGDNFVATKTFAATSDKEVTALEVTTEPSDKDYLSGQTFDTTGMVVKATYDDNSVDENFTDYTVSYQNGGSTFAKGETKVTLKAGSGTVDVTGISVKGQIAESDFTIDTANQVYTGTQITPSVSSTTLTADTDYTVEYGENKNVGSDVGTITIRGNNDYTGTVSKTFTINPVVLTSNDLEFVDATITKEYDGTTSSDAAVKVKDDSLKGSDTLMITGTAVYNSKDVETANTVTFAPDAITSGNYTLAATQTVTKAAAITATTSVTDRTPVSSDESRLNVVRGDGGFTAPTFLGVNGESATGSVSYNGYTSYEDAKETLAALEKDAEAEIAYSFAGTGNYEGAIANGTIYVKVVDIEFTVSDALATEANAVTKKTNAVYGDNWEDIITVGQNIVAKVNGVGDSGTGAYTLQETGKAQAGEQSFNIVYNGTINGRTYTNIIAVSGTVQVAPKTLTLADLEYVGTITKVYDGTTSSPLSEVTVKTASLIGSDTIESISAGAVYNSADVATANSVEITTTEAITTGNYRLANDLSFDKTASITPKTITPTIEPISDVNYNGLAQEPTITVSSSETGFGTSDYSIEYSNNINVGDATVTVKAVSGSNYTFNNVTAQFTINKIVYTGTKTADDQAMYGNSGTYDLTQLGLPAGYDFADTVTVADTDGILDGVPTISDQGVLTYKFKDVSANVGKTAKLSVEINSTNYTAFTAEITVEVSNKMTQDTFKFTDVELDKTYGDASFALTTEGNKSTNNPTFASDNEDVVSIVNGVATIHKPGIANITATVAEDLTYLEDTATQVITVSKKEITVEANAKRVLVDGEMPTFDYEMTELASGDNVLTEPTVKTNAVDTKTAGEFEITIEGLEVENSDYYTIEYVGAKLNVVQVYEIRLDANGGKVEKTELETDVDQKIIGLENPTRNSIYSFDGWYTALENGKKVTADTMIAENMTLYAIWSKLPSEGNTTIDGSEKTEIDNLASKETLTQDEAERVNDLAEVVVYNLNKETARNDAATLEELNILENLFIKANPGVKVTATMPVVSEDVAEDQKLPLKPVEVDGLALSVLAGQSGDIGNTEFRLNVSQINSVDANTISIVVNPEMLINGDSRDITNAELQSPVSFKLYINDTFDGEVNIVHKFTGGGQETFKAKVMSDEGGKYVYITVTQFSEFVISQAVTEPTPTPTQKPDGTTPSTGDDFNPLLWISIIVVALAGIGIVLFKRRQNHSH